MKAIKCEMCNSSDVVKQDGFFVCQSCGTKYSVEEAKKLMVEGTVKIDTSDELANLYEIARRAKEDNNTENAHKYYDMILAKDPSSWEANFYTVYYQAMNCKIGEIQTAATRVCNCLKNVLRLVKDNVPEAEQNSILNELNLRVIGISGMLSSAAVNHYNGIGDSIRSNYRGELNMRCIAAANALVEFGVLVVSLFGDDAGKSYAVPAWKMAIPIYEQMEVDDITAHFDLIRALKVKIARYDEGMKEKLEREYVNHINSLVIERSRFKFTCGTIFWAVLAVVLMIADRILRGPNPPGMTGAFLLILGFISAAIAVICFVSLSPSQAVIDKNIKRKKELEAKLEELKNGKI